MCSPHSVQTSLQGWVKTLGKPRIPLVSCHTAYFSLARLAFYYGCFTWLQGSIIGKGCRDGIVVCTGRYDGEALLYVLSVRSHEVPTTDYRQAFGHKATLTQLVSILCVCFWCSVRQDNGCGKQQHACADESHLKVPQKNGIEIMVNHST